MLSFQPVVAVAVVAIGAAGSAIADSPSPPEAPLPVPTVEFSDTAPLPACPEGVVRQAEHRKYVKAVYRRLKITRRARERIRMMQRCGRPAQARTKMRNLLYGARQSRKARARAAARAARIAASLTPFRGPGGTHWAIPWAVVNCERERAFGLTGIWRSHNPSGAIGPYQLLGHGAPWPANTQTRRNAHHRIAARLYRSSGLAPWAASRGCWG